MDRRKGDPGSPSKSPSQSAACTGQGGNPDEWWALDSVHLHLLSYKHQQSSSVHRRGGDAWTIVEGNHGDDWPQFKQGVCGLHVCLPNTNHVPDHHSGVQSVQAERHPGRWDAIAGVQHMSRQRAQLCCCHDAAGQLWTAVDKGSITAEAGTSSDRQIVQMFTSCHLLLVKNILDSIKYFIMFWNQMLILLQPGCDSMKSCCILLRDTQMWPFPEVVRTRTDLVVAGTFHASPWH